MFNRTAEQIFPETADTETFLIYCYTYGYNYFIKTTFYTYIYKLVHILVHTQSIHNMNVDIIKACEIMVSLHITFELE